MKNLLSLLNTFPIKAKHKSFGEIEVFGIKTQSATSKYLMYYTQINGDWVWVYDYETELLLNGNIKDYDKKLLLDYGVKIQEYLLKPPFNLEHSQHGIACDKLADVRENFLNDRHAL
jgi:hypothetical protein